MPYAAPTDSRFMSAALSATIGARNAMSSSSVATSTTAATTSTIRLEIRSVRSPLPAVNPPTCVSASGAAAGSTSVRSNSTRSWVAGSDGAVVGCTESRTTVPSSDTCGGVTAATPSAACTAFASSIAAGSVGPLSASGYDAVTSSGPFAPGPKPSVSRSYDCRCAVDAGHDPASSWPSRRSSAGAASSARSSVLPISTSQGRRATRRASRAQPPASPSDSGLRVARRGPSQASDAGSSVTAAMHATSTASPDAIARLRMSGMPTSARPESAAMTEKPAKSTARPAVAVVVVAARTGSSPATSARWNRLSPNSA